jgi:MFS family permease
MSEAAQRPWPLRPGAATFGMMFATGAFGRAMILTIVPLEALYLLESARNVSIFFMVLSGVNLALSLAIPMLIARFRRRRVYIACGFLCAMAPLILATGTLAGLPIGALFREFGGTALFMVQNLYMMDHIRKKDFVRAEPTRLFFQAIAWGVGPALGVFLFAEVDPLAAYGLAATASLAELVYFRLMGIKDMVLVAPRAASPKNPLRFMRRFFSQPRLQLAYGIAVVRSTWWAVLNVYGPIYMVKTGAGELASGLVVGGCNMILLVTPLVGMLAQRIGVRRVVMTAFLLAGMATASIALVYPAPWAGFVLFLVAGSFVVALDAVGTVPFLRAVRARERPEMTTVYVTYGQAAYLGPMTAFSILLSFLDLPVVFVVTGLLMAWAAWLSRWIPRTM